MDRYPAPGALAASPVPTRVPSAIARSTARWVRGRATGLGRSRRAGARRDRGATQGYRHDLSWTRSCRGGV